MEACVLLAGGLTYTDKGFDLDKKAFLFAQLLAQLPRYRGNYLQCVCDE